MQNSPEARPYRPRANGCKRLRTVVRRLANTPLLFFAKNGNVAPDPHQGTALLPRFICPQIDVHMLSQVGELCKMLQIVASHCCDMPRGVRLVRARSNICAKPDGTVREILDSECEDRTNFSRLVPGQLSLLGHEIITCSSVAAVVPAVLSTDLLWLRTIRPDLAVLGHSKSWLSKTRTCGHVANTKHQSFDFGWRKLA